MTCILVDDEPLAREAVEILINEREDIKLLASVNNANLALPLIRTLKPSIIFLDIQMPGKSGLDLSREIPEETMIVFTTAYPEYAAESYDVEALDYLLKPIKKQRFHKTIEKAHSYLSLLTQQASFSPEDFGEEHVFIKQDKKFIKLLYSEIIYIEALRDYAVVHKADQKILTSMNLKTIFAQLPPSKFIRISRSLVVNKSHIMTTDGITVNVNGQDLAIGESYRAKFFESVIHRRLLSR